MTQLDQILTSYDYYLPKQLIAKSPAIPRDHSRLLVVDSLNGYLDQKFYQLPRWLLPGDLLILNDTKVIPASIHGHKSSGARVRILLLEQIDLNCWLVLVKPGKKIIPGNLIIFPGDVKAEVIARDEATNGRILQFIMPEGLTFWQWLEQWGKIPFPPYLKNVDDAMDKQYQTVYASQQGAVAAPTAGLHFTSELLNQLKFMGVGIAYVTLHVGIGTFRPVEVEDITKHRMHQEWASLPAQTLEAIKMTKSRGGRIFAVGTTTVRTLEGVAQSQKVENIDQLMPFTGKVNIFIYPGYRLRIVEGMITNFHLPCSSLLMLVSAFIGRERMMQIYQEAISKEYRFYSFGDAMLILPAAIC